jgi:hypothetical protein
MMKRKAKRAIIGMLAVMLVAMGSAGGGIVVGCDSPDGEGPGKEVGGSSPPPIDLLAPEVFETASFGFG